MRIRTLIFLTLSLLMVGCASPARVDHMTLRTQMPVVDQASALRNGVLLGLVTGGKATNPMWMSQVSNQDFHRALQVSLERAGLLANAGSDGEFDLSANLDDLRQPMAGASMTVSAKIHYTLTRKSDGNRVFEKTIDLPYTAAFNEAFMGSERVRIANEGAIRVNIEQLISELRKIDATQLTL